MGVIFMPKHMIWKSQKFVNRKCVLRCCSKCPSVNLPDQEIYGQYSDTILSILFHIYSLIVCCITRGRLLLDDKKLFRMCKQDSASETSTKIYTRKS